MVFEANKSNSFVWFFRVTSGLITNGLGFGGYIMYLGGCVWCFFFFADGVVYIMQN